MAKHKPTPLTAADAAAVAAVVDAEQSKTEHANLPSIDCCGRCVAFKLHSKTTMLGRCHLGPPTAWRVNELPDVSAWPEVHGETGWCAQFKEK